MFHDMEKKVATSTSRIEIWRCHQVLRETLLPKVRILTKEPNIFYRWAIAARRDEFSSSHNRSPRNFAVEADVHNTARTQQRQQRAPSGQRVCKVMQHS